MKIFPNFKLTFFHFKKVSLIEKLPLILNCFLLFVSVFISLTPVLNREFPKIARLLLMLIWYFSILFVPGYSKYNYLVISLFLLLWFCYEAFLRVIGFSTASLGNYFLLLCSIDTIINALFVFQIYSPNAKRICFRVLQMIVLINIIINISLGYLYPNIHHLVYFYPQDYVHLNYAMTEFYNALIFFVGISAFDILYMKSSRAFKFFDFLCIAISLFFSCFFEPRATSLLMTFALLIGLIFFKKNTKTMIIIKISIVISCFLIYLGIVTGLMQYILPQRVFKRIYAVFTFNFSFDESFSSRISLFFTSIKTWFSSPDSFVFGIGNHLGTEFYASIGQHSLITDYLAKYGCLGLLFLFVLFSSFFVCFFCRLSLKKNEKQCFILFFVTYFLLSFFSNSLSVEIVCTSFLLFAFVFDYQRKFAPKKKENDDIYYLEVSI